MLGVASRRGSETLSSPFQSVILEIAAPRSVSKFRLPDQCTFNLIRFHFSSPCSAKGSHCPISVISRRCFELRVDGTENYSGELEMEFDKEVLRDAAAAFPVPTGVKFSYGTAGFRADASLLPSTVFRMGMLAALRSLCTQGITGLMITASHNPLHENGVKVADPSGGMLNVLWEPYSDLLANAPNVEKLIQIVENIVRKENIQAKGFEGKVFLGRDTRPSGQGLLEAAMKGVEAVHGAAAHDFGILTTPQLHWMVRTINKGLPAGESDYFNVLSSAFSTLAELRPANVAESSQLEELIVDAANGVGASKLIQLQEVTPSLKLQVRNCGTEGEGLLNDGVGADFVQKEKIPPGGFTVLKDVSKRCSTEAVIHLHLLEDGCRGLMVKVLHDEGIGSGLCTGFLQPQETLHNSILCASIDGDADRLVYFYIPSSPHGGSTSPTPPIFLLDGDKIATLFASFIIDQLRTITRVQSSAPEATAHKALIPGFGDVRVAVIQTAYANGASTNYIKQVLGLEVAVTSTGVKYLHKKAAQYDVGIYFEANGHGTILFSDNFTRLLQEAVTEGRVEEQAEPARRLIAVGEMVNQAVGDALSGILMVETVLQYYDWSLQQWDSMYTDFPSRQLKVKVVDRAAISTTHAETRIAAPSTLQAAIDAEVGKHKRGRAFVRASGTEDVVRVYAEASTQESADLLADAVSLQVYRLAGGVGPEL